MPVVVDTNVLVAANGRNCPQATQECRLICVQQLQQIRNQDVLVIDDARHIIREYQRQVSPSGQPGVGDAFLKWVLTNQGNRSRCHQVSITPKPEGSFKEFPANPGLQSFDPSDHKFVAVALTHPDCPPVINAVDSDWKHFETELMAAGLVVCQLCPDCLKQES